MIPNEAEFLEALRKVAAAFEALGIGWYKRGGGVSDRQWDVLGVLRVQGASLNRLYLQEWAARLEVAELPGSALQEAGLPRDC